MEEIKQISIDEFERLIYNALGLTTGNDKEEKRYFTLMKKVEDPDDMRGMTVEINYKGGDPAKAIRVSIDENYNLEFENIDSEIKKAKVFRAFYETCHGERELEESVKEALSDLKDWLFYVQQQNTQDRCNKNAANYSLTLIPGEMLRKLCGFQLSQGISQNKGIYIAPSYSRDEKQVQVGDICMIENDIVVSKYDCAKIRPHLVLNITPDQKRALVVPLTTKLTDKSLYGEDSLCELGKSYYFNPDKKSSYLKFGKAKFVGYDQIGELVGKVTDEKDMKKYIRAMIKYWNWKDLGESQLPNSNTETTLQQNDEQNEATTDANQVEEKIAETIPNIEEDESTFVPLTEAEISAFYDGADYKTGYAKVDFKDIPLTTTLPVIEAAIREKLTRGIRKDKKDFFKIANSSQNRKVTFTAESNSERFAATFNEDQRDAQNFPKMEISIDSFRVRIKVNNGYFKVNQELTKELQKIMQQEWKYYYIYLAYNIIMRAKNAKDPVDKNTLEEYFREAGLKYNGDLAEVKYHLSSFRPELVECYVDFYEKPDEENE